MARYSGAEGAIRDISQIRDTRHDNQLLASRVF
jgi:hypothetical protein